MSRSKNWDFEPEPNELTARIAARARAREADMHALLTEDDAYARQHEALRRAAELLVECVDDFIDRAHQQAAREGSEQEIDMEAMYVDERGFHRDRVARILLREAIEKRAARDESED